MRSTARVGWLGLALLAASLGACEARVSLGGRCSSSAECTGGLVCLGARCRDECRVASECAAGLRCVAGPSGARVCSLPPEETCGATDPCDETLFVECRTGRCVTGCAGDGECAGGTCDTSGAVGICIEAVSVGDADAGASDTGTEADAGADAGTDAGTECLPESEDSTRTVPSAVLGAEGAVDRGEPAWLETLGAAPIAIDDDASSAFAIGVRIEGAASPEVLGAVVGSTGELTLRRGEPLMDNLHLTVRADGALAAQMGFSSIATRSSATGISLVGLRLEPSDELDPFAWVYRQDDSPRPLAPRRMPVGTYPGAAALFLGPLDEELFAVRFWPTTDVGGRLGIVASGLGVGNATDIALPPSWGARPVVMATAPSLLLVHEPTTRETRLIRVVRIATAPVLDDDAVPLETDGAPALAATTSGTEHRVLAMDAGCGRLPIHALRCGPTSLEDCALEPAVAALVAPGPSRVQATSFGRAIAILVDDSTGGRLIVLDEDDRIVDLEGPMILPRTAMDAGGASLRLSRTSIAAAATATSAVVAIGGLYVDAAERGARVRVSALRVTAP